MISEPELVGEQSFGAAELPGPRSAPAADGGSTETVGDDGDARPGGGPGGRRAPGPAWLWALGGAVVASAVWAGGLYAYGTPDPDLGGYRASKDLCEDAKLASLTSELGAMHSKSPASSDHQSLSKASCYADLGEEEVPVDVGDDAYEGQPASVWVEYVLHKKTDPGPEFEAAVRAEHFFPGSDIKIEDVQGLGERALVVKDGPDGDPTMHVLDGQAVFALHASAGYEGDLDGEGGEDGEDTDDLSGITPLMVNDMRSLMAELKK
ncbi:hypothetical protein OHS70_13150 [Streptomyces sp. NBC_00390]|uniref:hypothetical protein n=1 Tax=Streptomyces sp. NBC_00390 TaxID=2975736 RepID=UPI002E1D4DDE